MPLVRMLVSWGLSGDLVEDRMSNTLYFNAPSLGADPDYAALATDLANIYAARSWMTGMVVEVRAYSMSDTKPRPERAFKKVTVTGSPKTCAYQVALCLSYYADRNLPRRRGRIYTGPWPQAATTAPDPARAELITFGQALAGLGGADVDWSVYSPTSGNGGGDDHWRISNIWADNSWDIVRSRKRAATARSTATVNG